MKTVSHLAWQNLIHLCIVCSWPWVFSTILVKQAVNATIPPVH